MRASVARGKRSLKKFLPRLLHVRTDVVVSVWFGMRAYRR